MNFWDHLPHTSRLPGRGSDGRALIFVRHDTNLTLGRYPRLTVRSGVWSNAAFTTLAQRASGRSHLSGCRGISFCQIFAGAVGGHCFVYG
jgi:hypothetical protein